MSDYKLIDNEAANQYEFHIGEYIPLIQYIKNNKGEIYLIHTEVPAELEGQGVGSSLVEKVLENIEQQGLRLIPLCPFVSGYIERHPEWRQLVIRG